MSIRPTNRSGNDPSSFLNREKSIPAPFPHSEAQDLFTTTPPKFLNLLARGGGSEEHVYDVVPVTEAVKLAGGLINRGLDALESGIRGYNKQRTEERMQEAKRQKESERENREMAEASDMYYKGLTHLQQGGWNDFSSALQHFNKIEQNGYLELGVISEADFYLSRGQAYFALKSYESALKNFNNSVEKDPENQDARLNRALAFYRLNRPQDARIDAEAILKRSQEQPIKAVAEFIMGVSTYDRNMLQIRDTNLFYLERAIEDGLSGALRPLALQILTDKYEKLAVTTKNSDAKKGYWEKTVHYFQMRIGDDGENIALYEKLGDIYGQLGRHDEAAKEFQAAVQLAPDNAELHYRVGLSYSQMKDNDTAWKWIEKARHLDPKNPHYLYQAAVVQEARGYLDEALDLLRKINPKDEKVLARICELQVAKDEGLAVLPTCQAAERGGVTAPANIWNYFGEKYLKAGKMREAKQMFQKALKLDSESYDAKKGLDFVDSAERALKATAAEAVANKQKLAQAQKLWAEGGKEMRDENNEEASRIFMKAIPLFEELGVLSGDHKTEFRDSVAKWMSSWIDSPVGRVTPLPEVFARLDQALAFFPNDAEINIWKMWLERREGPPLRNRTPQQLHQMETTLLSMLATTDIASKAKIYGLVLLADVYGSSPSRRFTKSAKVFKEAQQIAAREGIRFDPQSPWGTSESPIEEEVSEALWLTKLYPEDLPQKRNFLDIVFKHHSEKFPPFWPSVLEAAESLLKQPAAEDASYFEMIAAVLAEQKNTELAAKFWEAAAQLKFAPKNETEAAGHFQQANDHSLPSDVREAHFKKAIEQSPRFLPAYLGFTMFFLERGEPEKALKVLDSLEVPLPGKGSDPQVNYLKLRTYRDLDIPEVQKQQVLQAAFPYLKDEERHSKDVMEAESQFFEKGDYDGVFARRQQFWKLVHAGDYKKIAEEFGTESMSMIEQMSDRESNPIRRHEIEGATQKLREKAEEQKQKEKSDKFREGRGLIFQVEPRGGLQLMSQEKIVDSAGTKSDKWAAWPIAEGAARLAYRWTSGDEEGQFGLQFSYVGNFRQSSQLYEGTSLLLDARDRRRPKDIQYYGIWYDGMILFAGVAGGVHIDQARNPHLAWRWTPAAARVGIGPVALSAEMVLGGIDKQIYLFPLRVGLDVFAF